MATLSRRRLFQLGAGGAALLGTSVGALRWLTAGYALASGEVALGLDEKEYCIAKAVVDALLPGGDGLPNGVDLGVVQGMDEQVWAADAALQSDFRAALVLIEHAPPLFGTLGRFTRLARAQRQELLERMLRSKREVMVQSAAGVKQMAQILYYATDSVWNAIGYDGPWIKERKPPASALAYRDLVKRAKGEA
jgi:hypothetical protein